MALSIPLHLDRCLQFCLLAEWVYSSAKLLHPWYCTPTIYLAPDRRQCGGFCPVWWLEDVPLYQIRYFFSSISDRCPCLPDCSSPLFLLFLVVVMLMWSPPVISGCSWCIWCAKISPAERRRQRWTLDMLAFGRTWWRRSWEVNYHQGRDTNSKDTIEDSNEFSGLWSGSYSSLIWACRSLPKIRRLLALQNATWLGDSDSPRRAVAAATGLLGVGVWPSFAPHE